MYYYTCIILTVAATISTVFIVTSKSIRDDLPGVIFFTVTFYYFLMVYYAY